MILRWTAMVKILICTVVLHIAVLDTCHAQQVPWRRASGTESYTIESLDLYRRNPDTLYAMGTGTEGFVRSTDRGEHWQTIAGLIGPGPVRVDPKSSQVIYVSKVGIGSGDDIVMSTDGGFNWRVLFIGIGNFLNVIEIDPGDERTVYVGMGIGLLFRSSSQGLTWDTLPFLPVYKLVSLTIAARNDSILYIGSLIPGVHKSTDRGSTWIQMPFITPLQAGPLLKVDPRNANTIYAAIWGQDTTRPGGVFKSTDGGLTWVEKNTGLRKQDRRIHTIELNPKNADDLFIGVSNVSGDVIFRSTNGGNYWFGFSNGLPRLGGIGSIIIDTLNGRAYAEGGRYPDSIGIFILDDITTELVQSAPEIPRTISLLQNYPNPFNPSTRIGYSVGSRELVNLKVYDILGREMATLVSETKGPGEYQVTWDGSGYGSGIYFYRLQTPTARITQKMLLVR